MKNNKVVYGWYAKGIPFYIGIGTAKRPYKMTSRNRHCLNKRAKAERGYCFEIRILHCNLSKKQACEIENSLISLYGRLDLGTGILTNMTDGGEGTKDYTPNNKGCPMGDKQKAKISKTLKGNIPWNKGEKMRDSTKEKLKNINTGKTHSQETKIKMSKARKGKRPENMRKCETPLGLYNSVKEGALAHNMSVSGFNNRLNSRTFSKYKYI